MSSSPESSTPYKSRLFNFLNRRYIKLNTSLSITLRQFGQVINTSIATIAFPFYLLFENGKKLTQLFSSSPKTNESLTSEYSDLSPRLLQCDFIIKEVTKQITKIPQIQDLQKNPIQGLASLLNNHQIVLVTGNNQIENIFLPEQQKQIKLIIRDARGDYWDKKRRLTTNINNRDNKEIKPKFNLPNPFHFLFRQKNINQNLEKLKQSKLSTNINTSSEYIEKSTLLLSNKYPTSNKILIFLDNFLTRLEKGILINPSKEKNIINNNDKKISDIKDKRQNKTFITSLIQAALDYFFGKQKNNKSLQNNNKISTKNNDNELALNISGSNTIGQRISNIVIQTQQTSRVIIPIVQTKTEQLIIKGLSKGRGIKKKIDYLVKPQDNPFSIQALIWAAVDYFFNPKFYQNKSFSFSFRDNEAISINESITDPWLSWEDLYGEKQPLQLSKNKSVSIEKKLKNLEIKTLINKTQISEIKPINKHSKDLNGSSIKDKKVLNQEKYFKEEEIEAQVITIGYEKHFLEIILEKLDKIILWLEEVIIKFIHKFFKLFK